MIVAEKITPQEMADRHQCYVAQQPSGNWFLFETKPYCDSYSKWVSKGAEQGIGNLYDVFYEDKYWRDTLHSPKQSYNDHALVLVWRKNRPAEYAQVRHFSRYTKNYRAVFVHNVAENGKGSDVEFDGHAPFDEKRAVTPLCKWPRSASLVDLAGMRIRCDKCQRTSFNVEVKQYVAILMCANCGLIRELQI